MCLWPLRRPTATDTRHQQATLRQRPSQVSVTACKRPPVQQAGAHPSISLPQSFTSPLLLLPSSTHHGGEGILPTSRSSSFFSLSFETVMKDYISFLLSKKKRLDHKGFSFPHIPYLLDLICFAFYFEGEMVYVQWGGEGLVGRASPLLN